MYANGNHNWKKTWRNKNIPFLGWVKIDIPQIVMLFDLRNFRR